MKVPKNKLNIRIKIFEKLDNKQQKAVKSLRKLSFKNVDEKKVKEDFYHPKSAHILAYIDSKLIGWAGIHETKQVFEGKKIKLGGYGICTHPYWRSKGIADKISKAAIDFLKSRGCDVGFLSVDLLNIPSIKLHQKNGFVLLQRKFSWVNAKGTTKEDYGGMIKPINSKELFEHILRGREILFVGKGYW